jgi:hypothetical protein
MAPIIELKQSDPVQSWVYGDKGVNGGFRLFSVQDLLASTPSPRLYQLSGDVAIPALSRYAAISHVWKPGQEVEQIATEKNQPLRIGGDLTQDAVISWFGLVQAAHGAALLGCEYLWLDLLCIDQYSPGDKKLQIKNMGNIYQRAEVVLVMFGGVSAVQRMGSHADWIDRAWTLQEATLCSKTYGLVRWDYGGSITVLGPNPVLFRKVGHHGIALVGIRELLRHALLLLTQPGKERQASLENGSGNPPTEFPFIESVGCVGNSVVSISELWGVLQAQENIRLNQSTSKREDFRRQLYSSTWRSMWLRTSTKPQDIVFSTMHLLDASIEVDYGRTQQDLILELSEMVDYPAWLDIGNLIPVDPDSGLLPKLPESYPNSLPSYLTRGTTSVPVVTYVSSRH